MTIHSETKIICLYNLILFIQYCTNKTFSTNIIQRILCPCIFPNSGKTFCAVITVCVCVDKLLAERYQIQLMRRMPGVWLTADGDGRRKNSGCAIMMRTLSWESYKYVCATVFSVSERYPTPGHSSYWSQTDTTRYPATYLISHTKCFMPLSKQICPGSDCIINTRPQLAH